MQQTYSISSSGKASQGKNREQMNRQHKQVPTEEGGGGVTRELGYVGIGVGGGILTIRFLLCVPLQILELNERTPQLFAVSCKRTARTLRDVGIASKRVNISGLVFYAPPETSHALLHSLQLKQRRHTWPPELPGSATLRLVTTTRQVHRELRLGNPQKSRYRRLHGLKRAPRPAARGALTIARLADASCNRR